MGNPYAEGAAAGTPIAPTQYMGATGTLPPGGYGAYPNAYGVPPPHGGQIEGLGGMPNKGAQFLSGIQAGENIVGDLQQSRRGTEQYNQEQGAGEARREADAKNMGVDYTPTDKTMPGTQFFQSVGHGLAALGHAVGGYLPSMGGGEASSPATAVAPPDSNPGFQAGGPVPGNNPAGARPPMIAPGAIPGLADGGPMPAAAPPDAAAPQAIPQVQPPTAAPADHNQSIEHFAQHLWDGALGENGRPNGEQALPGPSGGSADDAPPSEQAKALPTDPASALSLAQKDSQAAGGNPEKTPAQAGKPHSLTPGWFDESDRLMAKAAMAADSAGHDGGQVYASLSNSRTAFLQSHYMRELSSASAALESGDQDKLEQALRNANYYLPDGQDLKVQKQNGTLVYQDPFNPTTKDGKPNFIPVDQQHIAFLAHSAMDPAFIGDKIQELRLKGREMDIKQLEAQGAYLKGQGIGFGGQARLEEVASTNLLKASEAEWYATRRAASQFALKGLQGLRMDPTLQKNVEDTQKQIDVLVKGTPTTVTTPLSPKEGSNTFDSARVAPELKNLNGKDYAVISSYGAQLAAGGMEAGAAAEAATRMYQARSQMHPLKGDNSPMAQQAKAQGKTALGNLSIDNQKNIAHVWDGKHWHDYPVGNAQAVSAAHQATGIYMRMLGGAMGGGNGAVPSPSSAGPNPVDNEMSGGDDNSGASGQ